MNFDRLLSPKRMDMIRQRSKLLMEHSSLEKRYYIYRRLVSSAFNPLTGQHTNVWSETVVEAIRGTVSVKEEVLNNIFRNTGGSLDVSVGDFYILFDPSQLESEPQADDRIFELVTNKGAVKLTQSSLAVTGYATQFIKDGVVGGDVMRSNSVDVIISSVPASNDALTLSSAWAGTTIDSHPYEIFREYSIVGRHVDALKASARLDLKRAGE